MGKGKSLLYSVIVNTLYGHTGDGGGQQSTRGRRMTDQVLREHTSISGELRSDPNGLHNLTHPVRTEVDEHNSVIVWEE